MTKNTRSKQDPRINLAVSQDLYDYIKVMSGLRGESITDFLNRLIESDRKKNLKVYQEAINLKDQIK